MTKTEAQIREEAIRECIEALPKELWPAVAGITTTPSAPVSTHACRLALEALLPKPDPVEEIVSEVCESRHASANSQYADDIRDTVRWLISTGRLQL